MQEKLINDKKIIGNRRRYTFAQKKTNSKNKNLQNNLTNIEENENESNKDNKENNNNKNSKEDLNTIIENTRVYKKALTTCKTSQKYIDHIENYNNNEPSFNKSEKNTKKSLKYNDSENKIKDNNESSFRKNEKKNTNKSLNLNENKMNGLNSIIKKQFGELIICEENKIYINPIVHTLYNEDQIDELYICIQDILIRIQQRKKFLLAKKKEISDQLEKIGYRKR